MCDGHDSARCLACWYDDRQFYPIAHASAAHSLFCKRVYGRDLCQDGQTDMGCFYELLDRLAVKPADRVLDLGCGAGGLAEYLSDRTGASVTDIDNSVSGIATAQASTTAKRDRLAFSVADLNALDLPAGRFDAAIAIDSISWVTDLTATLAAIVKSIKAGGQLCILTEQRRHEDDGPEILEVDRTPVARALSELKLHYESRDYTAALPAFWKMARETAASLREDFNRDGAGFICDRWIESADEVYLPAINMVTVAADAVGHDIPDRLNSAQATSGPRCQFSGPAHNSFRRLFLYIVALPRLRQLPFVVV